MYNEDMKYVQMQAMLGRVFTADFTDWDAE